MTVTVTATAPVGRSSKERYADCWDSDRIEVGR